MRSFYRNRFFLVLLSTFCASTLTYLLQDSSSIKADSNLKPIGKNEDIAKLKIDSRPTTPNNSANSFFGDALSRMRRQMDEMDKAFHNDPFFSNSKRFGFSSNFPDESSAYIDDLKISEREDENYRYIDIESTGINSDGLNIQIRDGMVEISGEIEKQSNSDKSGMKSQSTYISRFQRSFNIPHGVDESKVDFKKSKNKFTIKFPKVKV